MPIPNQTVEQGHATEEINRVAVQIYDVMKEGQKVDKARNNVAGHLLDIARDTGDRPLFDKASKTAEAIWRSKTKGAKLPKSFVQARSDIKRFFDNGIAFYNEVVKDGAITKTPRTFSEMGKAYRLDKAQADKEHEKSVEADKPAGQKAFESAVTLITTAKGMTDEFLQEVAELIGNAYIEWREEHPAPEEKADDAPVEQGDDLSDVQQAVAS